MTSDFVARHIHFQPHFPFVPVSNSVRGQTDRAGVGHSLLFEWWFEREQVNWGLGTITESPDLPRKLYCFSVKA